MTKTQILKVVKRIIELADIEGVEVEEHIDDFEMFENVMVDFLYETLEMGMEVCFEYFNEEKKEIENISGEVEELFIQPDISEDVFAKQLRCYHQNAMYDVPIIEIDFPEAVIRIARKYLTSNELVEILYPERKVAKQYKDVEMRSDINFGFEIEGGFDKRGVTEHLEEHNLSVAHDGSVNINVECDEMSKELVYQGYKTNSEALEDVYKIIFLLNEFEFRSNETCGIHIHVSETEADDAWDIKNLYKAAKFYVSIEDFFYDFVPDSRTEENESRAHKLKDHNQSFFDAFKALPSQMIANIDNMDKETIRQQLGNIWYHSIDFGSSATQQYNNTRYVGFNVHSFFYRGTVEFRHFDSNYKHLPHWFDLLDKFMLIIQKHSINDIDLFIKRELNEVEGIDKVCTFLSYLGVAPSTFGFLLERIQSLHPDKYEEFDCKSLTDEYIESITPSVDVEEDENESLSSDVSDNPFVEMFSSEELMCEAI
ncbi:MAG: amidoligase family protein [Bacteroidales bacterium]